MFGNMYLTKSLSIVNICISCQETKETIYPKEGKRISFLATENTCEHEVKVTFATSFSGQLGLQKVIIIHNGRLAKSFYKNFWFVCSLRVHSVCKWYKITS